MNASHYDNAERKHKISSVTGQSHKQQMGHEGRRTSEIKSITVKKKKNVFLISRRS